jgi:hypothetical protein
MAGERGLGCGGDRLAPAFCWNWKFGVDLLDEVGTVDRLPRFPRCLELCSRRVMIRPPQREVAQVIFPLTA